MSSIIFKHFVLLACCCCSLLLVLQLEAASILIVISLPPKACNSLCLSSSHSKNKCLIVSSPIPLTLHLLPSSFPTLNLYPINSKLWSDLNFDISCLTFSGHFFSIYLTVSLLFPEISFALWCSTFQSMFFILSLILRFLQPLQHCLVSCLSQLLPIYQHFHFLRYHNAKVANGKYTVLNHAMQSSLLGWSNGYLPACCLSEWSRCSYNAQQLCMETQCCSLLASLLLHTIDVCSSFLLLML